MIKAVLFDYGGVISAGGVGVEVTDRLASILGVTSEQAWQYISPYWPLYDTGRITDDEMWAGIEKASGKSVAISDRNIWNRWEEVKPLPKMVDFVNELRSKNLSIGLLSNVVPSTAQEIRKHGGYDMFDFVVLSVDVGYAKPELEIYQIALEKMPGIKPDEIVFIDDQERCLVPARELGIQTILANDADQVIRDVKHSLL